MFRSDCYIVNTPFSTVEMDFMLVIFDFIPIDAFRSTVKINCAIAGVRFVNVDREK